MFTLIFTFAVIFTCTGKPYRFCKAVSTFPEGTYLIQVRLFIYFGLPLAAQNLKGVVSRPAFHPPQGLPRPGATNSTIALM